MKSGSALELLRSFRPGQRVYLQGGPGECAAFYQLLRDNPGFANGVDFWSCLVPGINTLDYGSLRGDIRLTTFMASPALAPSIASGQTTLMAMPYSEIGGLLARTDFDVAIFQTSPADAKGQFSFAHSCDMGSVVWPRSKRNVLFVNEQMRALANAESISADNVAMTIALNEPLLEPPPARKPSAVVQEIARLAADLVPDGATFQAGIGDTPAAIVSALKLHRGLRVHSGIITQEYQQLAESGALDPYAEHITGVAWGDRRFRDWLPQSGFIFRNVFITHGHDELAAIPGFVSIGSALEVDLAGNLNLEWRAGHRVSSVGGAPDYLRAAAASDGGRSIIALQAATAHGGSRIVPNLKVPSISGVTTDTVVTEHGVARLKGLSHDDRAQALIALAAPEHRSFLSDAYRRGVGA
ncbi:MAG TPA: acetyl-CoA hydrolase/transferase C-terminal domain-containing protein [Hyphomonadaceae bacterium]|nr:acetyl-CoA hydrolase/transferase C-terminal domain-containing protein [Hyphomonadaceae bacterium]